MLKYCYRFQCSLPPVAMPWQDFLKKQAPRMGKFWTDGGIAKEPRGASARRLLGRPLKLCGVKRTCGMGIGGPFWSKSHSNQLTHRSTAENHGVDRHRASCSRKRAACGAQGRRRAACGAQGRKREACGAQGPRKQPKLRYQSSNYNKFAGKDLWCQEDQVPSVVVWVAAPACIGAARSNPQLVGVFF